MNQSRAKPDRVFDAFFLALVFGPAVAALLTGNWWWLAVYIPVGLIFWL